MLEHTFINLLFSFDTISIEGPYPSVMLLIDGLNGVLRIIGNITAWYQGSCYLNAEMNNEIRIEPFVKISTIQTTISHLWISYCTSAFATFVASS